MTLSFYLVPHFTVKFWFRDLNNKTVVFSVFLILDDINVKILLFAIVTRQKLNCCRNLAFGQDIFVSKFYR